MGDLGVSLHSIRQKVAEMVTNVSPKAGHHLAVANTKF
jgi:hypothetical protein